MAEHRSLLVAQNTANRHTRQRTACADLTEITHTRADLRQHLHRNTHLLAEILIPLQRLQIHEQRARRIRHICAVERGFIAIALRAASQIPQQPRVDRAEQQIAGLPALAGTFNIVENPLDLRCGRIGVNKQPSLVTELLRTILARDLVADRHRARILPHDRVVHGLPRILIPHHGGLALVSNAYSQHIRRGGIRSGNYFAHCTASVFPNFHRIVLDPTLLGKNLLVLELTDGG